MQAINLDLNKAIDGSACDIGVDIQFSFRPFIDYVIRKTETEKTDKVVFYKYILKKFKAYPELWQPVETDQLPKYVPVFDMIYSALSPLLTSETDQLWAISKPVCPCFYFGTSSFYQELMDSRTKQLKSDLQLPSLNQMKRSMLTSFYNLVLERYYNFNFTVSDYTVRSIMDAETKLLKYYRLNVDSRFLEISFDGELPELKLQNIKEHLWNAGNSLQILESLLPPEKFKVYGFAVVNLVDVTGEYALETIKNIIIKHHKCRTGFHHHDVEIALKTLVGCADVEFGLTPFLQLNGKLVMNHKTGFESIVAKLVKSDASKAALYEQRLNSYIQNPRRVIFPEITEKDQRAYPLLKLLVEQGITSFAVFPLYFNDKIVGGLEIYTRDPELFKNYILSKLESAIPMLSQLMQNLVMDFNHEIINVITDKFTALQPAVEWRFYEAAYNYLYKGGQENQEPIENIFFKNLQPFYGAIDIKDSSIKRNLALRADLDKNLLLLQELLCAMRQTCNQRFKQGVLNSLPEGDAGNIEKMTDREVLRIEDFLTRQLPAELMDIAQTQPELEKIIQEYLQKTSDRNQLYVHSLHYEESMQKINQVVNSHLEQFNATVQEIYPCYFEKFRTDGVEYDIYAGKSISPNIPVPTNLVHTLRFKQLEVMAEIARATAALLPDLPVHMQTTQLIFVYEKLIDISFRLDEQRFDVEGSYNIRYQMVKKRVDKATKIDSKERLTQPGKITVIYFNSWEAAEYRGYIKKLQEQQLLLDDIEYIDVEELQGVQGLKAIRVSVLT
ncbi:GAF domain-containing protein [Pedobacter immunditicola]|uniref:GAF domain-containing protein n=1 Tax=Pedobacter immunditicola TaxID=3133440 RepID=UPI0030B7B82E